MGEYNIPIRLIFRKGFGFNIVDINNISNNTYTIYNELFNNNIYDSYKDRIINTIEALSKGITIIVNKGNDYLYGYKQELFEIKTRKKYKRIDIFYKGNYSIKNIYKRVNRIIKVNFIKFIYYYFLSLLMKKYIDKHHDNIESLKSVSSYKMFIKVLLKNSKCLHF